MIEKTPVEGLKDSGPCAWMLVEERRPSEDVAMNPTLPFVPYKTPLREPIVTPPLNVLAPVKVLVL